MKIELAAVFIIFIFVSVLYLVQKNGSGTSEVKPNDYVNKDLGFSLTLPAWVDDVRLPRPGSVTFTVKDESWMAGFVIEVENTGFQSTADWLAAQPKGSATSTGVDPVLWIGSEKVVLSDYVVVDQDDDRLIYGKYTQLVVANRGRLYRFRFGHQGGVSDPLKIEDDILTAVQSLKFLP